MKRELPLFLLQCIFATSAASSAGTQNFHQFIIESTTDYVAGRIYVLVYASLRSSLDTIVSGLRVHI